MKTEKSPISHRNRRRKIIQKKPKIIFNWQTTPTHYNTSEREKSRKISLRCRKRWKFFNRAFPGLMRFLEDKLPKSYKKNPNNSSNKKSEEINKNILLFVWVNFIELYFYRTVWCRLKTPENRWLAGCLVVCTVFVRHKIDFQWKSVVLALLYARQFKHPTIWMFDGGRYQASRIRIIPTQWYFWWLQRSQSKNEIEREMKKLSGSLYNTVGTCTLLYIAIETRWFCTCMCMRVTESVYLCISRWC